MPEISVGGRAASQAGIADKVDQLSTADKVRLHGIAVVYARGTSFEPEDLFQETVQRTLAGRRRCPPDVSFVKFLSNAMRSIASADRKSQSLEQAVLAEAGEVNKQYAVGGAAVDAEAVERREECKAILEEVLALFDEDDEAQLVLMGVLDGLSAAEIRKMNGMDEKEYATVRRRIRRGIQKAYPKGWNV